MRKYQAEVGRDWMNVWANSLDEALEKANENWGAKAVGRVRPAPMLF